MTICAGVLATRRGSIVCVADKAATYATTSNGMQNETKIVPLEATAWDCRASCLGLTLHWAGSPWPEC